MTSDEGGLLSQRYLLMRGSAVPFNLDKLTERPSSPPGLHLCYHLVSLFSMEKLRLSDVSMKKRYPKTCGALLYIHPTPERYQEIFTVWVQQLLWQTNSLLFGK